MTTVDVKPYRCSACGAALLRWRVTDAEWASGYEDVAVDLTEGTVEAHEHLCVGHAPVAPVFADRDEAAQWLAKASGSPRYGEGGYGWQGVLDSEANAQHAAALAHARLADDGPALTRLSEAKRLLGLT